MELVGSGRTAERDHGPPLTDLLVAGCDVEGLAAQFVELHAQVRIPAQPELPDLIDRLRGEIDRSGLPNGVRIELRNAVDGLTTDQPSSVCHFDFHPGNVLVADRGWVVIDWLTAANGPPAADIARSLLLQSDAANPTKAAFVDQVRRLSLRHYTGTDLAAWTRVVAAARLAEDFDGDYATWLASIATGEGT